MNFQSLSTFQKPINALLALEDGSLFYGTSIGSSGATTGELVFNTALTGYQEILTDPSYTKQIVTLTYPHIGNIGCNSSDSESNQKDPVIGKIHAAGLVIRNISMIESSWRGTVDLTTYLQQQNIVGIEGVDTRKLTNILRQKGALKCVIIADVNPHDDAVLQQAKELLNAFSGLNNQNLADEVSCTTTHQWNQGTFYLNGDGSDHFNFDNNIVNTETTSRSLVSKYHVVAVDFGVKNNILRLLKDHFHQVTVVPSNTSSEDILAMNPDGVFLSNGPGDPQACTFAIEQTKNILAKKVPLFGICLGHQILGLASGALTEKMKFGHHGANHPVQNVETKRVYITSQNHGFAISENAENPLPNNIVVTHRSLFDDSIQGIKRTDVPAFSFQGHPEAAPGPQDITPLFMDFVTLIEHHQSNKSN